MSSFTTSGSSCANAVSPAYPAPRSSIAIAEAERAERGDAVAHVLPVGDRGALGDLEHDAVGELGERRVGMEERVVVEIVRVEVHEEDRVGRGVPRTPSPRRARMAWPSTLSFPSRSAASMIAPGCGSVGSVVRRSAS